MGFTTIKTKHLAADGIIVGGSARLKSVYFQHGASVGTLTFKDGATAGTTFLTINTMADKGEYQVDIPEPGYRCTDPLGPYVAITGGVSFVTVFYD